MKPIFKITAGNDDITSKIRSRLLSINISDETGLVSDKAEITLDDSEDILQIPALNLKSHWVMKHQAWSRWGVML